MRFQGFIHTLVNENQSGFIKGRNISNITVKIGEMYCIVVALAIGIDLMVEKNMVKAVTPKIPLPISQDLLLPKKGILAFLIMT